jgi:hypothetical protein
MIKFAAFRKLQEESQGNPPTHRVVVVQAPGSGIHHIGHARDLMETAKNLRDQFGEENCSVYVGVKKKEDPFSREEMDDVASTHADRIFGHGKYRLNTATGQGGDICSEAVMQAREQNPGRSIRLHIVTGQDGHETMQNYANKMVARTIPEFKQPGTEIEDAEVHSTSNPRMKVEHNGQQVETSGTNLRAAASEGDSELAGKLLGYSGKHLGSIMDKLANWKRKK